MIKLAEWQQQRRSAEEAPPVFLRGKGKLLTLDELEETSAEDLASAKLDIDARCAALRSSISRSKRQVATGGAYASGFSDLEDSLKWWGHASQTVQAAQSIRRERRRVVAGSYGSGPDRFGGEPVDLASARAQCAEITATIAEIEEQLASNGGRDEAWIRRAEAARRGFRVQLARAESFVASMSPAAQRAAPAAEAAAGRLAEEVGRLQHELAELKARYCDAALHAHFVEIARYVLAEGTFAKLLKRARDASGAGS